MLIRTIRPVLEMLSVEGYTFDEREWTALEDTLSRAGASTRFSPLERDSFGREGRRYNVVGIRIIEALEALLRGRFDSAGRFEPEPGAAKQYACREDTRSGLGQGCKEFAASDG